MDETDHGLTPRIADLKVNRKVNEINDLPTPPPRQCWFSYRHFIALKTRETLPAPVTVRSRLALAERADRLPAGRMPPQQLLPCLAAQTPSLDAFHFACSLTVVDAGILGSGGSEGGRRWLTAYAHAQVARGSSPCVLSGGRGPRAAYVVKLFSREMSWVAGPARRPRLPQTSSRNRGARSLFR